MKNIIPIHDTRTLVMGILNLTPDSFYDGGLYNRPQQAVDKAMQLINDGADVLDIGGESSRPGAEPVSPDEEINRVIPVIRELVKKTKIPISIDTYKSTVADMALQEGAKIVNDITGLSGDKKMISICVQYACPVIIMHMQGTPQTMQIQPHYTDVLNDIKIFFKEKIQMAVTQGIKPGNIILDPGIGFGKTIEHNLILINRLKEFTELHHPILIGLSRKSFIGKILDLPIEERLEGSLAGAAISVWNGAKIIRIHDVKETVRLVRIVDAIKKVNKIS